VKNEWGALCIELTSENMHQATTYFAANVTVLGAGPSSLTFPNSMMSLKVGLMMVSLPTPPSLSFSLSISSPSSLARARALSHSLSRSLSPPFSLALALALFLIAFPSRVLSQSLLERMCVFALSRFFFARPPHPPTPADLFASPLSRLQL